MKTDDLEYFMKRASRESFWIEIWIKKLCIGEKNVLLQNSLLQKETLDKRPDHGSLSK